MGGNDFYVGYYEDHYFAHHGILGQKWGIRRYQNSDGTLTESGRKRYQKENVKTIKRAIREVEKGWRQEPIVLETSINRTDLSKNLQKRDDWKKAIKEVKKRSNVLDNKEKTLEAINKSDLSKNREKIAKAISEFDVAYDDYYASTDKVKKIAMQYTKEVLGIYGDKKVKDLKQYGTTYSDLLEHALRNAAWDSQREVNK